MKESKIRTNKGITMVALVITIIVLLILAGISFGTGSRIVEVSKLENVKTNMLLIEVKAKEYIEQANFNLGTIDKVTAEEKTQRIENAKKELNAIGETSVEEMTDKTTFPSFLEDVNLETDNANYIYYYKLSTENMIAMGLTNVKSDEKDGWYIIKYDVLNLKVEIYNTKGFELDEKIYYSLNEIKNLEV